MSTSFYRLSHKWLRIWRVILPICLVFSIAFVFFNSAKTGEESAQNSASALVIAQAILGRMGISMTELLLRKLAHVTEYALVGFFAQATLCVYRREVFSLAAWPLLLGVATAAADEAFQLTVPGRGGSVVDVWIDFAGVVVGVGVGLVLAMIARKKEKRAQV